MSTTDADSIDHDGPRQSANGHAYRAYLDAALDTLSRLTALDYYPAPLPSPADDALMEVVEAFTAWPAPVRDRFAQSLPPDKRGLFGLFGHRAATLAARRGDADLLRLGLIGNAIANYEIPPHRNVEAALAVFYHCARKLALEPASLFDDVALYATDEMAARLVAFGRRASVDLRQFGWREIRTADGVRYKFEW
jgi:hypothetical protein